MVKTCAFCEKTDGMCYTSNSPKRKCTITGKFHEYDHICDLPITNADRIRAMSDEELAKWIDWLFGRCEWCDTDKMANDDCNDVECTSCILEWLKQPAEG